MPIVRKIGAEDHHHNSLYPEYIFPFFSSLSSFLLSRSSFCETRKKITRKKTHFHQLFFLCVCLGAFWWWKIISRHNRNHFFVVSCFTWHFSKISSFSVKEFDFFSFCFLFQIYFLCLSSSFFHPPPFHLTLWWCKRRQMFITVGKLTEIDSLWESKQQAASESEKRGKIIIFLNATCTISTWQSCSTFSNHSVSLSLPHLSLSPSSSFSLSLT